jgi:Flp pilus assembly pilin Flp
MQVRKGSMLAELGQGMVEYALILALIAIVVIFGLTVMGEGIADAIYNDIIINAILSV